MVGPGWSRNQEFSTGLSENQLLGLSPATSQGIRKLGFGKELGLKPRHSDTGCRFLKRHHNHYTRFPAHLVSSQSLGSTWWKIMLEARENPHCPRTEIFPRLSVLKQRTSKQTRTCQSLQLGNMVFLDSALGKWPKWKLSTCKSDL